nr:hypothetical protein [Lachnospiraceae bacterium]
MCSILAYCGKTGDEDRIREALLKTISRGPDASRLLNTGNGWLGFNRLSIMGLTNSGMQPFLYGNKMTIAATPGAPEGAGAKTAAPDTIPVLPGSCEAAIVCNGEIYGFRPLKEELEGKGYSFISDSDCEILPALYREYGTDMFAMLDAEYALVLYDAKTKEYIA